MAKIENQQTLIITCFSSVGAEAIYFYKPLIVLDHLKQDIQNYVKEGVAFQATNDKTLNKILQNILNGSLSINKEVYPSFISKYAYKIDGKTSIRIIDFISNIK